MNFTKDDLKKVIRNHNKQLKKEKISMAGSVATLLSKVSAKYSIKKSGANKYTFTHKRENIKYEVEQGTDARKAQDTKFKKQQDEKKSKALTRKNLKVAKKKADTDKIVAKTRQEERKKTLQKIKIAKELKLKNMFKEHAKTNTKKHIKEMKKLMKQGDTFKQAHSKVSKTEKPKPTKRNTLTTPKTQATPVRRAKTKRTKKTPNLSRANTQMTPLGIPVGTDEMAAFLGADIKKETGSVYFTCRPFIFAIMLLYILQKHKNDCIAINPKGFEIVTKNGVKKIVENKKFVDKTFAKYIRTTNQKFGIYFRGQKISFMGMNKTLFFKGIKNCLSKNKMVVIPLTLLTHMNAIIINGNTRQIIRYEPHGRQTSSRTLKSGKINAKLKAAFSTFYKTMGDKDGDWEFLDSQESCPYTTGFRGLQAYSSSNNVNAIEIRPGDPGGFCCMWTLFIMDLTLKNPTESIRKIRLKATDILKVYNKSPSDKNRSGKVRQFIRGYTKYLMSEAIPAFIKNAKKNGIALPKLEAGETLAGQTEKLFKGNFDNKKQDELEASFMISILELLYKGNTSFI